jgi:hypothetical protein
MENIFKGALMAPQEKNSRPLNKLLLKDRTTSLF